MLAYLENISGGRYGQDGFPIRPFQFSIINTLHKRIDSCLVLLSSLVLSCPMPLSALSAHRGHDKIALAALTLLSMETQVGDRTHNFNHATRLSHRDCIRRSTRYGARGSTQYTISFLLRISGVDLRPEGTSSLILVYPHSYL